MFKTDNQQGSTVQHMELCSMFCGRLDGRGSWGRMDKSLCCLPETVTTLLVNQLYLNTKFKF